jgi:hypothetical protein
VFRWQLRNVDELSLRINKTFEDGTNNVLFDTVKKTHVIRVEKWIDEQLEESFLFHISDIDIVSEVSEYKEIKAYSLEVRMNNQSVRDFEYTVQLYTGSWDENDLTNSGIVDYILDLFKGQWAMGYISTSLLGQSRNFNIQSSKVLDAVKIIENNFNCLFIFHSFLQIIDIVEHGDPLYNLGLNANTGLILAHQNYVNQYRSQVDSEDIITRLYVYGQDDTSISGVNILGTDYIDDFSFYMTTEYMSQSLIDALTVVQGLIVSETTNYDALLVDLRAAQSELLDLGFELFDLQTELNILEDKQDLAIKNEGVFDGQTYAYWKSAGNTKQAELDAKQVEIDNKELDKVGVEADMTTIATAVSYETNLTLEQQKELVNFIKEGEQSFDTDDADVLMELGRAYLQQNAQSSYNINVDIIDIFGSKAESYVWNKIKLGHKVNLIIPYE